MKYKALIVDVDGTLVVNKKEGFPSEKVTKAINKASKIIHIGVASSRPLFMLSHIFDHLKLSGPSIMNGGAQIIDLNSKKILWEQTLNFEDFVTVCKILKKERVNFFIHDDGKDISLKKNYQHKKPFNIVCLGLDPKKADFIASKISHIPTVSIFKMPGWEDGREGLLISHVLSTKQHAILEVAKILNISTHEIIGVGDGYNDFPLLMACGLKIAMGNAVPDLKEIADYIAPPVEKDGVADIIERFVLNNEKF